MKMMLFLNKSYVNLLFEGVGLLTFGRSYYLRLS